MENKENNVTVNYDKNIPKIDTLNIRHKYRDEAMFEVEKFIEYAKTVGIYEIKVIHGKQGGILKAALHEYLRLRKDIASFRLGNYYEGQYGVTIINIEKS